MDAFGIMPITFVFDLKDDCFLNDLKDFVRYFTYIEVANELVAQGKQKSVGQLRPDQLVQSLENRLYELHRHSVTEKKKQGGLAKTGKLVGTMELRDDKARGEEAEVADEKAGEIAEGDGPSGHGEAKSPQPKPKGEDEVLNFSPKLPNESAVQELIDANPQAAPEPKLAHEARSVRPSKSPIQATRRSQLAATQPLTDPEAIENDRIRKLIDRLRNPPFQVDHYYLPLVKMKSEARIQPEYTKVVPDDCASAGRNIWIIKVAGMNRGFGVEVFETLEQLRKLIKDIGTGYQERIVADDKQISRSSAYIKTAKFVIQKYIERPLLFRGRKMDLRVWVMFSHENKPYVFRECYVRLSSAPFDISKLNEKFVHLTNNALQKYSEQYDEDETLKSTQEWETHLREGIRPDYDFKRDTWPAIRRQIKLTHQLCAKQINLGNKRLSFEIFGYDFMLDENFRVWLIETNTNPSITTPGVILKAYVPRMVDDAFKITLDKIFPPKEHGAPVGVIGGEELEMQEDKEANRAGGAGWQRKTFPMPGYDDDENLWDLIDEKV